MDASASALASASTNYAPTTNTTEPSARNATTPAARPLRRLAGAMTGGLAGWLAGCRAMGAGVSGSGQCAGHGCCACTFDGCMLDMGASCQVCTQTVSGNIQHPRSPSPSPSQPASRPPTHTHPPNPATINDCGLPARIRQPPAQPPSSSSDTASRPSPNARRHMATTPRSLMLHPTLTRTHLCAHCTPATDTG